MTKRNWDWYRSTTVWEDAAFINVLRISVFVALTATGLQMIGNAALKPGRYLPALEGL